MPIKMNHSAVQVSNIKNSIEFFTKALGIQAAWSGQEDWGLLKSEGTSLALIQNTKAVHPPHIGFVVENKEDVDKMREQIKKCGATDISEPKDHRDQSRSFYFKDPDGNQFELVWLPDNLTR